jgi:hypothetical protein
MTIAPHLPAEWDSVTVDNVPVGGGRVSFVVHRADGAIKLTMRRIDVDRTPIEVVFSPALPIGARVAGVVESATSAGDVHATVRTTLGDSAALSVSFTGGWSIIPPVMPATIGSRSRAARVLSERVTTDDRYVALLEGLAGQGYSFRVRSPDAKERVVEVKFPTAGANADGYTTTTLSLGRAQ